MSLTKCIQLQLVNSLGNVHLVVSIQLQELEKNGDETKQELYRKCRENGHGSHPLKVALTQIGSPSLLDRVQERPDVEGTLRQLRRQRLKERGNIVYIRPQAKAGLQARDEARFPVMEKVEEFLSSDQNVFLLLGDSGAGKSTFNRELECHLWQSYKKNGTIPLHINLPAIDKPEYDMIAKQLKRVEFTEPQIRVLKQHRRFILICDGYDESQQTHNLYTSNKLNQPGEWNAKMVISCRSEYLGVDYRDRFQPGDRNSLPGAQLFQEAVITPFSMIQVEDYITQYVSVHRPLWEAREYKKALDLIPSLKELVKNPFLMSLSLEVLPRMVDPGQDLSVTHITRMALYDQFIEHWLERGKKRLGEKNLSPQSRSAFESLIDEGFTRNGIDYLKRLSVAIYKEQSGQPIVSYSRYKDENAWKGEFFSRDEEKQLLREACPLIRNGNQHRFIHRSLLEYGVALAIYDPQELKEKVAPESSLSRRRSTDSIVSVDEHDPVEEAPAINGQGPDLNSPFAWRSFLNDPSILQFLEERVQQEPLFKQLLLEYIEQSKSDKKWRTAASNSITILVRAGVEFIGADLRGIRVPNADLSYGLFDSAQLQGADLRQVDLRGAWLREANLSQAQMTGVRFGELPLLKQESSVTICLYSPNGETISAGLFNGNICVYSTSNWERLWTFEGHSFQVMSVIYSPDSNRIVSCSQDMTIRIWDILTGVCTYVLEGYSGSFQGVAYSPEGDQVAIANHDGTVKVWNVETGECRHIWIGHTSYVSGVLYSPKGNQIASRGYDKTVRLWDTEAEMCLHVLHGYEGYISGIAYSPHGDRVASCSSDKTVRLWDVATGACHHIFADHTDSVNSVIFSPNGDQVASYSADNSVRLWDAATGVCLHSLLDHNQAVKGIAYSPQGDLITSASGDMDVQIWDTESGVCRQILTGHSAQVTSVVFSPKGEQVVSSSYDTTLRLWDISARTYQNISRSHGGLINKIDFSPKGDHLATGSKDGTVRIWDVATGICRQKLRGHNQTVRRVVYSPQGNQIATSSDDRTIRIWNTETGECSHSLTGHTDVIFGIAYSPNGEQLASASDDRTVRFWDVESGECRNILIGHTSFLNGILYSPNGNQAISYGGDNEMRIWNTETGACDHTLSGHGNTIQSVTFSPQGDQIVSASYDTTVRVWDVGTGECSHIMFGHNATTNCVTYSPTKNQIASGGSNGSLKIWDLEAETCLWTLAGHSNAITKIVYSSQGEWIVSASMDKSVRLWDVASGLCRAVIQGFQGTVNDIDWIEGTGVNYLATGCSGGLVGMWKVEMDEDHCRAVPHWMTTKGELNMTNATIEGVHGLSSLNKQLLKQRGAVGEPTYGLREASKKLATMASVVSKLKAPSDKTEEDPVPTTTASVEQLEQWLEQGKGLVASMKNTHRDK